MFHKVHRFLSDITPRREPELARMEKLARTHGFPIVGPLVGRYLYQSAVAIDAKKILELGSGYGYSAFWFSLAAGREGKIVMTDSEDANRERALAHFEAAGLKSRFDFRVGDALEIASGLRGKFDIVFNDIDKHDYPKTVEIAAARLRKGGLFITDNVIWSGRVADGQRDRNTSGIVRFLHELYADSRFFTTVLPLRDGLAVAIRV